jgi:hypothetical protein
MLYLYFFIIGENQNDSYNKLINKVIVIMLKNLENNHALLF